MTTPERRRPEGLADYLAVITRAIFQAGLSWKIIDAQWTAFERLFAGFDPALVASFDDGDIERILADGGIVRTRKKIAATVANARTLLELERSGSVAAYLRSFAAYEELARDLKARFAFVGDLSAYYLLFRVGEAVPRFEQWERTIAGDHPRMREMVAHARAAGYDETVALSPEETAMATQPRPPAASAKKSTAAAKSSAKKSAAKKSTAKKSTAKKSTAKQSTAKPSKTKPPTAGQTSGDSSSQANASVGDAIGELQAGTLRSGGSGKKVTDRKQAIAIGLSEARRAGANVPPKPKGRKRS